MIQEAPEPPAKVGTPSQPTQGAKSPPAKTGVTGELSHIATKCLMKIMYIARFARQECLRAVGALTTMITSWDEANDRKPFRIIKFISGTVSWRQLGFMGDSPDQLQLGLFSDADFAGYRADMRSTSGVFLAVYGDHCFLPICGQSKKQTAVSHSTVEADCCSRPRGKIKWLTSSPTMGATA